MGLTSTSRQSSSKNVGIGSRELDFGGDDLINFEISSSVTRLKLAKECGEKFSFPGGAGQESGKFDLILSILSPKKAENVAESCSRFCYSATLIKSSKTLF